MKTDEEDRRKPDTAGTESRVFVQCFVLLKPVQSRETTNERPVRRYSPEVGSTGNLGEGRNLWTLRIVKRKEITNVNIRVREEKEKTKETGPKILKKIIRIATGCINLGIFLLTPVLIPLQYKLNNLTSEFIRVHGQTCLVPRQKGSGRTRVVSS